MVKLAIRYNNTLVEEPCAICGRDFDLMIPLELFLDDRYLAVCEECGKKHAPHLVMLLNYYYKKLDKKYTPLFANMGF